MQRFSAVCAAVCGDSRRDKAKVRMPENDNSIPLDDEDILDLTVVAEPGAAPGSPNPDGPPEPGDMSADFGADLDALLDSLGVDDTAAAPTNASASAGDISPAPIADQTPVTHKVDPNEELAMPDMLDIDSLLAELGAEVPAEAPSPEPEVPPVAPSAATNVPTQAPIPEFDSILAQAQAAEARKAEEEALAAEPVQRAQAASADTVPTAPVGDQTDVPNQPVQDEPPVGTPEENIDLNELDALLDDILATAPEMSTPAASPENAVMGAATNEGAAEGAKTPAPVVMDTPEVLPVPEQAIMPGAEEMADLVSRVQRLEDAEDVAALAIRVQHLEEAGDMAALGTRVQGLEKSVGALADGTLSEAAIDGLIAAKLEAGIAAVFEPNSPVMERIVTELMGRMGSGAFNETLEKMAAAAAAKVIREEIAALMQEKD